MHDVLQCRGLGSIALQTRLLTANRDIVDAFEAECRMLNLLCVMEGEVFGTLWTECKTLKALEFQVRDRDSLEAECRVLLYVEEMRGLQYA